MQAIDSRIAGRASVKSDLSEGFTGVAVVCSMKNGTVNADAPSGLTLITGTGALAALLTVTLPETPRDPVTGTGFDA